MEKDERQLIVNQLKARVAPDEIISTMEEYKQLMTKYGCAIREVRTKFEVLNDELSIKSNRNPIHAIHSRVKSPESVLDKLNRKNLSFTLENIQQELSDVAGIRVICDFVDDIYEIADMLLKQDDIKLINYKDYIRAPKPNGYRSYHMIVEIPVFFSEGRENLKVEVQLRTIAMDFWASLEHELRYKKDLDESVSSSISAQLLECASTIADMDSKMQDIKNQLYPKYPVYEEIDEEE
ncbi:MAG: GTP pyrophosphokinase family protein [Lachnospiraceae bacterium]|nr:GTP pyrophosphokinase family protein [Lachnospiraceae bacterium]